MSKGEQELLELIKMVDSGDMYWASDKWAAVKENLQSLLEEVQSLRSDLRHILRYSDEVQKAGAWLNADGLRIKYNLSYREE